MWGTFQSSSLIVFDLGQAWYKLNNVAEDEGIPIGDVYDKISLEQCKQLCRSKPQCRSFAFGQNECFLKEKCIEASEPQKVVSGYQTYYTPCEGNISNF